MVRAAENACLAAAIQALDLIERKMLRENAAQRLAGADPPKRRPRSVSWLIVAGPPEGISANALHCATISDSPDCQWKGGEHERVEAKNRAALKAADEAAIEDNGYFTDPDWHEAVSPDGVKCFVTRFVAPAGQARALPQHLTGDLSIHEFLRRT